MTDTVHLAERLMHSVTCCTLQRADYDFQQVMAEVVNQDVILTAHKHDNEDADPDGDGVPQILSIVTDHIDLSHEGWVTLVEMFALRFPDRFARVVDKWRTLQERKA